MRRSNSASSSAWPASISRPAALHAIDVVAAVVTMREAATMVGMDVLRILAEQTHLVLEDMFVRFGRRVGAHAHGGTEALHFLAVPADPGGADRVAVLVEMLLALVALAHVA